MAPDILSGDTPKLAVSLTMEPRLATAFRLYAHNMQMKHTDILQLAVREFLHSRGVRWE